MIRLCEMKCKFSRIHAGHHIEHFLQCNSVFAQMILYIWRESTFEITLFCKSDAVKSLRTLYCNHTTFSLISIYLQSIMPDMFQPHGISSLALCLVQLHILNVLS
jgi:hypothetical protein